MTMHACPGRVGTFANTNRFMVLQRLHVPGTVVMTEIFRRLVEALRSARIAVQTVAYISHVCLLSPVAVGPGVKSRIAIPRCVAVLSHRQPTKLIAERSHLCLRGLLRSL